MSTSGSKGTIYMLLEVLSCTPQRAGRIDRGKRKRGVEVVIAPPATPAGREVIPRRRKRIR